MHARSLIRIINCHALKQIAQHGIKLKRIQHGRKIRTEHERIRNGSKTDNEILLNGNGTTRVSLNGNVSFFLRIPYVVLLCHGSLLYSYAHVSLVFIKRFWEKLFSTDVVETRIERMIVG